MQCKYCGGALDTEGRCLSCGESGASGVRVLSDRPLRFYSSSWLSRFVGSFLFAAILLLLFIVVFPLALVLAAVGIVVWLVLEFLRRY